ncbi:MULTISPECIES: threonine--tRNA ligase [Segatella]|jgi:threonyl-tRNA synthetase|uniref:Threonine--tRNA ligase n=1 Tax=Segatella copri TaxID=165179 RepID=A0AAW5I187_9BACT|nr:threonine--tRNA ligase [Segatella copri]MCF0066417.1 threonine--tRNA ligase [Segatella copri]MCP9458189.1 threonine--tRNA ligase [Segatella copri]MCP9500582.1 threonine--tRNA ligase [Segatella copri]MCP9503553.1 threonine--tRNA ligase [Segatella copri]MCP9506510.1 threonine--tRNA ligase [Segatella copri]
MVKITFPDGSVREYEQGVTGLQIAESISPALARNVVSCGVNGETVELNRPINEDANVELYKFEDEQGKHTFWHTSAHLLAEALQELYPGIQFGFGPAVESGFFYDVMPAEGQVISENDFAKIEAKMMELAKKNEPVVRKEVAKAEALAEFKADGQTYKCEHIEQDLEDGTITTYTQGNFTDLCRGPHLMNTGLIKAVKITSVAGAFWRGDAKREQMTRIYGISFPKKKMLDEYLVILEEAKKRDHRKIGKEMELFMFSERVGKGLPIWLPKGTQLRLRLQELLRSLLKPYNYQEVICPGIGGKSLYVTSGHYAHYGKDAFQPIQTPEEDEEYMLKPMNCPHHCEVYARKPRSYKDLPLRIAEFGTVFRYEKSGELHGLTRVRTFTQDDAHIFVRSDQVKSEFENVIDVILKVFKIFGFENYEAQISLRDPKDTEKYIGSDEIWEESENAIREACKEKGLETREEIGEAAFYGPKLDFMVKDAIGRRWQLGTIQVDYNLPERFKLEYTAEDNSKKTPVMIHRAPFGSLERFTAVLIEHTAGHFPLWLTPDQVAILPISEKFNDYAQKVRQYLDKQGVRALVDDRNEKIGRKIRDNELKRVPYMVIVGEKESAEGLVSMRKQGGGEQATMSMEEFAQRINAEVAEQLKAAEE